MRPFEVEVPVSTVDAAVITGRLHKEAALSPACLSSDNQRASGKVGFLGCGLERNAPRQNACSLVSHFFPLKLHHPFPPDSFQPGPQHPAEGPRRLHSQKGSLSWESQPQRSWGLGNISKILEDRGLGPHYWGALGTLVSVRKTRQKRFKRGSQLRAHCLVVSTPPQSSDGTQAYSGSRDGIAVQVRKVGGNKQGNAFIFFNFMPMLC